MNSSYASKTQQLTQPSFIIRLFLALKIIDLKNLSNFKKLFFIIHILNHCFYNLMSLIVYKSISSANSDQRM